MVRSLAQWRVLGAISLMTALFAFGIVLYPQHSSDSAVKKPASSAERPAPEAVLAAQQVVAQDQSPKDEATPHPAVGSAAEVLSVTEKPVPAIDASVIGLIVDQRGAPIAGAAVYLQKRPEQENPFRNTPVAQTDADGTFRVSNVQPNLDTIFADHPNYSPGWTSIAMAEDHTDAVRITLVPGGGVEGVLTVGGRPCKGDVSVLADAVVGDVSAGENGAYRIDRVTPGIVEIVAFVTKHRNMLKPAIVEPGKTTRVDFDFPGLDAVVEGYVTANGTPVPKAIVTLGIETSEENSERYSAGSNADGFYRFDAVPSGEASMAANAMGEDGPTRRKCVSFEVSASAVTVQDIDLTPGPCAVSGRIEAPAGTTSMVAILHGDVVVPELTLSALERLNSRMVDFEENAENVYRFDGIDPGTYTLLALAYPETVKSTEDHLAKALALLQVIELEEGPEIVVDLRPLPVQ